MRSFSGLTRPWTGRATSTFEITSPAAKGRLAHRPRPNFIFDNAHPRFARPTGFCPMTDPDNSRRPRQNSAQAVRFLHALGRDGTFAFRALPDQKDSTAPAKPLSGCFESQKQELRRLNDQGYGVFVQINASDGKGIAAANIRGATCFFVDFDGTPIENISRLSLTPHIVVETSPGKRHFYWRVDGIPLDRFSLMQKRLIALFGSDKSVHDLPRVMRLPGFLHQKDKANPHLVTCEADASIAPYTFTEFDTALTEAEKLHGIAQKPEVSPQTKTSSTSQSVKPDLERAKAAISLLVAKGQLSVAEYSDWLRIGIAIKNTFGEDGFALFLDLSAADESFVGEDDVRKTWDTIKLDRADGDKLTMGTFFAQAKAAGWVVPKSSSRHDGDSTANPKASAATVMIELASAAGDEIIISTAGTAYVTISGKNSDGGNQPKTMLLASDEYKGILALRYHEELIIKTAAKDQINSAIALMEARAQQTGERVDVHLRSALHNGRIYVNIDPAKGIVAEVDKSGWRIMADAPPVRFISGSRGALPMPEPGGTLETFARHFNTSPDDLLRVVGFLIATLRPSNANPMLLIEGVAGSAKSTMGDKCLALVDPPIANHAAGRFSMATDERNLHVQAARCTVMFLDNVSTFSADVADQICRLLTGGALSSRKLFSDGDEYQTFVTKPCIVTCIGSPTTRGDLLDRTLRVTAETIAHRRTERAVWEAFKADSGKMVGFLLDCTAAALGRIEEVEGLVESQRINAPRLADFAVWVEAASAKLGLNLGEFSALLSYDQEAMQRSAVEGDPLIEALAAHFSRSPLPIKAVSAGDLLKLLSPHGKAETLPHSNQIKTRLQRLADGLKASGFKVEVGFDAKRKVTTFNISVTDAFLAKPGNNPGPKAPF